MWTREAIMAASASSTTPAKPAAPFIELAEVLKEYDAIVDGRLDPRDAEADFVMRGSDWRVLRAAFRSMLSWPKASAPSATQDKLVQTGWARLYKDGRYDVMHGKPRASDWSDTTTWTVVPLFRRADGTGEKNVG
jgi:hypothetical protein